MTMLYIYCEGSTEEIFVKTLLVPYFEPRGIYIKTILASGRGGVAQYEQVKRDLTRICREHSHEVVTTLIDYSPVKTLPFECVSSGSI